jgi:hypothetical protein
VKRELRFDRRRLPDELDPEYGGELPERQCDALDLGSGSIIAPHRVERDADHRQLSSTSSRFFPA